MIDKTVRKVRATLKEMWHRYTPIVKDDALKAEIYYNGENNLYPYEVEGVINNSPTAFRAAQLKAKYIAGKGLKDGSIDPIVNVSENLKLSNIITLMAESISYHNGVFIHVGYGYDEKRGLVQKTLKVMDYVEGRKKKEDVNGFENSFVFKDWKKLFDRKTKKEDVKEKTYYPYNPNKEVVLAQIKHDSKNDSDPIEAIKKYRGQIFYLNLNPRFKYSSSPIDSVYNDADSEYRFGLYTNTQFRSGFLGKTLVVTPAVEGIII